MKVIVYSTRICGYCDRAKALLRSKGIQFEEVGLDDDHDLREALSRKFGGYRTVPMIVIDDTFVGGYNELLELSRQGKL